MRIKLKMTVFFHNTLKINFYFKYTDRKFEISHYKQIKKRELILYKQFVKIFD